MSESLLDPSDTFATLCTTVGLDVRLRKALSRLGYVRPTLVQSRSLPLAVTSGRDLLVRARTGSGKTLAYLLPLVHKILALKSDGVAGSNRNGDDDDDDDDGSDDHFVRAVILVPTRELCSQVQKTLADVTYYCDDVVSTVVLSAGGGGGHGKKKESKKELAKQEAMLRDRPDVVISTPAGLLTHIRSGVLVLKKSVQSLVVDEADLVLSYGYAGDIAEIVKSLPKICQGFLMSATLSPELNSLKRVVLHSPAILKLEEEDERKAGRKEGQLSQFYLNLPKKDKNLVVYVFLKLGLLKGKGLFFVNTTDGGYRLKLFLEQFHIRSAVLNAELPLHSRLNIIEQFNAGNFDYLVATDESTDAGTGDNDTSEDDESDKSEDDSDEEDEERESGVPVDNEEAHPSKKKPKRQKKERAAVSKGKKKDSEYGVARGLDFRGVSFVVNIDFPLTVKSYTHRIGRTARGGAKGVALSFVEVESAAQNKMLSVVQESQPPLPNAAPVAPDDTLRPSGGPDDDFGGEDSAEPRVQMQPTPLDFDLREIEGFRYRVEDVGRAVTKIAVKETRAAELRAEILNSERLQNHFADNPADLQLLRHDRVVTHVSKVQDHLKHVPKYMLPRGMQVAEMNKRKKRRRARSSNRSASRRTDNDPLQSYEGGDVTLDGIAGAADDDVAAGDTKTGTSEQDAKKAKVFVDSADGTGRSTSGRNQWKQKHGRGKFSRRFAKKHGVNGGSTKAGW